jgi:hypothetical protein
MMLEHAAGTVIGIEVKAGEPLPLSKRGAPVLDAAA